MIIEELKSRKQKSQGFRKHDDGHYRSKGWKLTRTAFREQFTKMPDGTMLSNKYCLMCYLEDKMRLPGSECDHIQSRKSGGTDDFSNLRTLCRTHHAIVSANQGKEFKK